MTQITDETPRNDYTIAGEIFSVPAPYTEGHPLTAGEASQLNQVFAENVRNNLASKVSELKEANAFDAVEFQKTVDEYCDSYQMGVRSGGGGRVSDPVQTKAMEIAKELVRDAIKQNGIQLSTVTAAQITDKARTVLEDNPQIRELARDQVEANRKIAAVVLDSLPSGKAGQVEPAEAEAA